MPTERLCEEANRLSLEKLLADIAGVLGSVYTQPTSSNERIPTNSRVLRILLEFRTFGILIAVRESDGDDPNRA